MWTMGWVLVFGVVVATPGRAQLPAERTTEVTRLRSELALQSGRFQSRARLAERRSVEESLRLRARTRFGSQAARGVSGPPEAWLPQDPADSLYREARSRLNARRYAEAARSFAAIRSDYPRSGYVGDAYYFEALARSRMGAQMELRRALELLSMQSREHPAAASLAEARSLAVRIESQLARRGDAAAAEALVGAARGRSGAQQVACDEEAQALRATALSALLQMDPARARPILREVLRDRDECSAELRSQAIFILGQDLEEGTDDGTIDLLVELAHGNPDPDPEVRQAAVFWLAQTGRDEAIDALISILESGTATPEITEQAMFALGQAGNERAMRVLRDYATNPAVDAELRGNAIFWLAQIQGSEAGPFLRSLYESLDEPELKERVFFAIAESSSEGNREWLTARALDPNEDVQVRTMALFWAAEAGLTSGQALQIYRTAEDRELRQQAIFVLTQVADDDEAVDALIEIVRTEEDRELREQAVFWLGESDDPRVAEILLEIIRGGGGGGG
jgi:HEAT repeat protein